MKKTSVTPSLPRLLSLLAALALWPLVSVADEDELQWYHVEIIVFEQREATGRDAERWQIVAPEPQADEVVQLQTAEPGQPWQPFTKLPSGDLQLSGMHRQLERADPYQPLLHLGWRQQGLSRRDAPSVAVPPEWSPEPGVDVELQAPAVTAEDLPEAETGTVTGMPWEAPLATLQPGPPLYGYVRLYRERFLHVAVDLRYHRDSGDAAARYPYLYGQEPVFVMEQRRRMRSGELHYLDHPVLGVLVQVTPVDPPAETAEGAGD